MGAIRLAIAGMLALGFLCLPTGAAAQSKTECSLEDDAVSDYDHARFAPEEDIRQRFEGFEVSFDSDDDDGRLGTNLLRVPHWVAQEIRRWQPPANERENDDAWCLNTGERPDWFTDDDLFEAGVAPDDDSYRNSGYDRGHMAMKLLVERLGQHAAYCTHTTLNAIPQRSRFNQQVWQDLENLTGAWAQIYGRIWVIQGPVFYPNMAITSWIGDEGELRVAVPDAAFKIVIRARTEVEAGALGDGLEVLAFIYPQLGPGYFRPRTDYRHERFLTTVDEIEQLTGLDFRLSTDRAVERSLERRRAEAIWEPSVVDRTQKRLFLTGCPKTRG